MIDLRHSHPDLTGKQAQQALDEANITTNKNTIPGETRSPFQASGVRLGGRAWNDAERQTANSDDMVLVQNLFRRTIVRARPAFISDDPRDLTVSFTGEAGTLSYGQGPTLTYDPAAGFTGPAIVDVTLSYGQGDTFVQTVDLNVQVQASANPAPLAAPVDTVVQSGTPTDSKPVSRAAARARPALAAASRCAPGRL